MSPKAGIVSGLSIAHWGTAGGKLGDASSEAITCLHKLMATACPRSSTGASKKLRLLNNHAKGCAHECNVPTAIRPTLKHIPSLNNHTQLELDVLSILINARNQFHFCMLICNSHLNMRRNAASSLAPLLSTRLAYNTKNGLKTRMPLKLPVGT
eukprot:5976128-Amphidinium_carterae.2